MDRDDFTAPHPGDQDRDGEILDAYRRIFAAVDGTPTDVLAAAREAFHTRDLDGEIAVLVADSRTAGTDTVYLPVRAEPDPAQGHWLLSFAGGGIRVDMQVGEEQGRLLLLGMFSGTSGEEYYLESADGQRRIDVDRLGRFAVEGVAHGPVRLWCRSSDGIRVTTDWVTI